LDSFLVNLLLYDEKHCKHGHKCVFDKVIMSCGDLFIYLFYTQYKKFLKIIKAEESLKIEVIIEKKKNMENVYLVLKIRDMRKRWRGEGSQSLQS